MNSKQELATIKNQIFFLTIYSILITIILTVSIIYFNTKTPTITTDFDIINVKRINIIEEDGTLRLTISNKEKSPAPLTYGKEFGLTGGNRCGLIFFNEEGTECGGLTFSGVTDSITGEQDAFGHLSFDQYNQNQVLYFQYSDDREGRQVGLHVTDWQDTPPFPVWNQQLHNVYKDFEEGSKRDSALQHLLEPVEGQPAYAKRVFLGRDTNKAAVLNLSDKSGNVRLQFMVDSTGTAKINFLNNDGEIESSFPSKD